MFLSCYRTINLPSASESRKATPRFCATVAHRCGGFFKGATVKKNQYDRNGSKNPRWNGGLTQRSDGRWLVYSPGHPYAYKNYVLRYRRVMEIHLGRYLLPSELVHHKNGDSTDDRLENLELTNHSTHAKQHEFGKSTQKLIAFNGLKMNIGEWADRIGVTRICLYQRLQAGWSLERALQK